MQNLVIVESPTKARTLSKYLGDKYQIEASMGHIRDLPKSDIGVDVEHNFEPKYIIPRDKLKRVNELKKVAKQAQTLWLATDPDREGEAIAWHLKELMVKRQLSIRRVVFHEITPDAIKQAFASPREIDLRLVDAQQARRVLDRLVGYKLSPVLWKKVKSGLSAGRVQSVALRLIVEREREVLAFNPEEYWVIEAELSVTGPVTSVSHVRPRPLTSGSAVDGTSNVPATFDSGERDLSSVPPVTNASSANMFVATLIELNSKRLEIKKEEEARGHVKNLEKAKYNVSDVSIKEVKRHPSPPFTTSTLQQTASNRLGLTAKKTMMLAQGLYERGLITYMRTDSVNLSDFALKTTREYIEKNIGKNYLPSSPRVFKTKSKVAQEAHEAIRPTDVRVVGAEIRSLEGLTRDHLRLYDLIWKRMVASQMAEAVMDQVTINVSAGNYLLRATGSTIKFEGWLKVYGKDAEDEDQGSQRLPDVKKGEDLNLIELKPSQHFTEPPARFNEASLIKKLEELGIGRPSTYAPTLSTIIDRYYVEKRERKFFPTELGIAVIDFLVKNFPDVFDYGFTAGMEDALDEIARGERKWRETIAEFYKPFEEKVEMVEENAARVKVASEMTDKICPKCGKNLQVKFGRFGKFLACSGFPDCKYTEGFEEKVNAKCPDCGGDIVMRRTKKGRPFYGCSNWPNCKYASWNKPKTENSAQGTVDSGQ